MPGASGMPRRLQKPYSGRPARCGAVAHGAARYPELKYTRAVATNGHSLSWSGTGHRLHERIAAVSAEIELLAEVRLVPHGRAIHIGTSTPSGHLIAGSYLPKARVWRRAPCRNPPSLRISSAPLLDCSGRVPPAPDLPKGPREAFPLWHSGPPAQCQLRRAPTVPR